MNFTDRSMGRIPGALDSGPGAPLQQRLFLAREASRH